MFSVLIVHMGHLAPADDLTPSAGINDEHPSMVNGKVWNITDADLIKTATTAEVSEMETKNLTDKINTALFQHNILH